MSASPLNDDDISNQYANYRTRYETCWAKAASRRTVGGFVKCRHLSNISAGVFVPILIWRRCLKVNGNFNSMPILQLLHVWVCSRRLEIKGSGG